MHAKCIPLQYNEGMALLQVRDVPDHLYRRLVQRAQQERRSIAQQTIAMLARDLDVEVAPKARRKQLLDLIRSTSLSNTNQLPDPAKLIREDRRR